MTPDAAAGWGFFVFLVLVVPGLVLFVCWVILPFAVVGTKPLLRALITETRAANVLAERQAKAIEALALAVGRAQASPAPSGGTTARPPAPGP